MSIFPEKLFEEARVLLDACRKMNLTIATAESCTGGLVASLITEIPGASKVFQVGFVTYDNDAKCSVLGVNGKMINLCGAVSSEIASAMAEGAMRIAKTRLAIAVTGIAGPDGGTPAKPVGTVHIAVAAKNKPTLHHAHLFTGDRSAIRMASVDAAMRLLAKQLV